jgi:hypothetical protein
MPTPTATWALATAANGSASNIPNNTNRDTFINASIVPPVASVFSTSGLHTQPTGS